MWLPKKNSREMTILIVLPILALLMFDLGLCLQGSDFVLLFRKPKALVAGMLGQLVWLPVVGLCVGAWTGLDGWLYAGLLLIACCPGGSSSNVFSMLADGDVALSVSLTAASSLITLLTMPLVMMWGLHAAGLDATISLPVGNLLLQNLVMMFLPIAIGMGLRLWKPVMAERWHGVLKRLAFPLLVLLAGLFFVQNRAVIADNFASLGMAATLLVAGGMVGGALMAWLFGLGTQQRRTLVIEVGMQNAAEAIALAVSPLVFAHEDMAVPAILYALMMNVLLLGYVGIVKRLKK